MAMPQQKPGRSVQDYQPIPGYPMRLRACSDGHIYSQCRQLRRLTEHPNSDGYPTIDVWFAPGQKSRVPVHILTTLAFHGPRLPGTTQVRHLDGVRNNNAPDNLVWGSAQENADDRERHGRTARGARHGSAKLTEQAVTEIRRRLGAGELQKTIAHEYGLCKGTISHIWTRRN